MNYKLFYLGVYSLITLFCTSQEFNDTQTFENDRSRIVFYNVENLFDIYDDSLTRDEEFLPEGVRYWDNRKFYSKVNNIYRVLISIGGWNPPDIIGLCEVENRFVLNKLVFESPLKKMNYRIIHFESFDRRGIDVAMLYRNSFFKPDTAYPVPVIFDESGYRTRDILYVKGVLGKYDTIHLFINHWPSRYGGYLQTISKRNKAAEVLRKSVDSLNVFCLNPKIIIMGDFNDGPSDESIKTVLGALNEIDSVFSDGLFNLMPGIIKNSKTATLKYKENWDMFDQIIVSGSLLNAQSGYRISKAKIYDAEFLLEPDEKYLGTRPKRTFIGLKYHGGFSDHLPVYVDLKKESSN